MKTKFLSSSYDAETKVSSVTLSTPYGIFTSYAKCAPEDAASASRYNGCSMCEIKCLIKALKSDNRTLQIRLKEAQTIYNACCESPFNQKATSTIHKRVEWLKSQIDLNLYKIELLQKLYQYVAKLATQKNK